MTLTVAFTDQSSNYPTGWLWSFGDGGTSGEQHPEHLYSAAGSFTVTLTVSNTAGLHSLTKPSFITVVTADHEIYLPLVLRNAP